MHCPGLCAPRRWMVHGPWMVLVARAFDLLPATHCLHHTSRRRACFKAQGMPWHGLRYNVHIKKGTNMQHGTITVTSHEDQIPPGSPLRGHFPMQGPPTPILRLAPALFPMPQCQCSASDALAQCMCILMSAGQATVGSPTGFPRYAHSKNQPPARRPLQCYFKLL